VSARKKVLFVVPSLSGGGAERVMATLLKHLDRARFEPLLALTAQKGTLPFIPEDVLVFDLKCLHTRRAVFKLASLVRRRRPDVVFSTLGYLNLLIMLIRFLMPKATAFIARETNIPSINIHQTPYPRLFSFLYRALYPKFDCVVCQSQDMKNDLVDHFRLPLEKTAIINNPVDVAWIKERSREGGRPLPPGAVNLLAAGKLMHQKGFDLLLQAFAKINNPGFHLTILGQGKEETNLKNLAEQLGIKEQVTFAGFLDNPYPAMAQADVFVLSSRFEGFPNVVLEACACGAPVAAFDCPGDVREIITPGVNGLLAAPEDAGSLAEKIEQCASASWDKEKIVRSVSGRFGAAQITKQYEALFESIA